MKSVNVKNNLPESGPYCLSLGDGTLHTFKNRKAAEKFQNETNRFLTDLVYTFNELYSNIFSIYRQTWTFFYNTGNKHKGNQLFNELKVKESLQIIDELLEKLTTSYSRQDSYYMPFHDFHIISQEIQTIIFELSNEIQNKSICIFDHKLRIYSEQNQNAIQSLQAYSRKDLKHKITIDPLSATFQYLSISKQA